MPGDSVILLHGLGRTSASLARMRAALTASGYRAVALDYHSTRHALPDLTASLGPRIAEIAHGTPGDLHFVGHSMGGLLARALIAQARPERLGRLVMLGPPNRGSEIADRLGHLGLYRRVFGPAGLTLGTRSVPVWPDPDYPVGVIAGTRTVDPIGWLMLPRPNDGRVSVAATRIAGLQGHLVLPVSHALMMHHPTVIAQTLRFLAGGGFGTGR
ncbi:MULTISPECIES: alpha/beta fold hydrolase [unclassified Methylobacterium]|uniref:alpha/beta fold hydrolase n=1 Tax=unclassified Methylobacterium TaxID=2615210 RepID=UPI0011C9A3FF|nr:alpha/beta fold hydrolase [Methylobacterium sp. WL64]TXN02531.1 alpha/beta hydrolase [Methylobacterium sp. WL64]